MILALTFSTFQTRNPKNDIRNSTLHRLDLSGSIPHWKGAIGVALTPVDDKLVADAGLIEGITGERDLRGAGRTFVFGEIEAGVLNISSHIGRFAQRPK